jgi:biopolymer transport protein ExbD
MPWQLRHQGSPQAMTGLSLQEIAEGLRDGLWEGTDEVIGPGETSWQAIENHPSLAELAEEIETPPPPRHVEGTHLDFNALIDVCLVLLIFFILTTTYAAAVQKVVPLPTVRSDGKAVRVIDVKDVKSRMIRVQASLDSAHRPSLLVEGQPIQVLAGDGQTIDTKKLSEALRPYVQGADRKTEIILDAKGITWGTVIAIQDGAKAAGVHTIHHLLRK